jgi:hypothetical protein
VQVIVGPTPIPDGEAAAAGDITVINEKLAFALAVESPVPYGVPRGAIIDVGPVVGGKPARDRVVFADFIPNNWSAWPNTYQKVDIVERGPQQVVVKATRDWGKVTIATTYTLRAGADRIEMQTTMTNTGDTPQAGLLSGQTLWPSAGYFFGVPASATCRKASRQERWPSRRCVRRRLEHHAPCAVHELRWLPLERPAPAAHAPTRRVTHVRHVAAGRSSWRPEPDHGRRDRAWPLAGGHLAWLRHRSRWQAGE